MSTLHMLDADPADIIVIVNGGMVDKVIAPPTLSIQVRTYDKVPSGELCQDEEGRTCRVDWIKEPGEANIEAINTGYDAGEKLAKVTRIMTPETPLLRPCIIFHTTPNNKISAVSVDDVCMGFLQREALDGDEDGYALHLGEKAPAWLREVRDRGPWTTLEIAQYCLCRFHDQHRSQGSLAGIL